MDTDGKVINSASFKVLCKDLICTPRFTAIVEPITKVKIGTIHNTTTNYVTANENEYFLDQSTDLKQGGMMISLLQEIQMEQQRQVNS